MADGISHCFPPSVAPDARVLILGSLPGQRSLAAQQYYAHPQNAFWRIMSDVVDQNLPALAYAERLEALHRNHIGLWDVVASASRKGSLDQHLRDVSPNSLSELVKTLPDLRAIAFNGAKAAAIGMKQLAALAPSALAMLQLPSTSPAHAGMRYPAKRDAWVALRRYLQG